MKYFDTILFFELKQVVDYTNLICTNFDSIIKTFRVSRIHNIDEYTSEFMVISGITTGIGKW